MRLCVLALFMLAAPASAAPPKLTLEQAIAKAVAGPRVRVADGDTAAASARVDEADAARLPRVKATAFGTISPDIDCKNPECTVTGPENFALRFEGLFGGGQLDITQPLYTYG